MVSQTSLQLLPSCCFLHSKAVGVHSSGRGLRAAGSTCSGLSLLASAWLHKDTDCPPWGRQQGEQRIGLHSQWESGLFLQEFGSLFEAWREECWLLQFQTQRRLCLERGSPSAGEQDSALDFTLRVNIDEVRSGKKQMKKEVEIYMKRNWGTF